MEATSVAESAATGSVEMLRFHGFEEGKTPHAATGAAVGAGVGTGVATAVGAAVGATVGRWVGTAVATAATADCIGASETRSATDAGEGPAADGVLSWLPVGTTNASPAGDGPLARTTTSTTSDAANRSAAARMAMRRESDTPASVRGGRRQVNGTDRAASP